MTIQQILDDIYIGDRDSLIRIQGRKELGITAVLNCAKEIEAEVRDGESYLHLPIYDSNWLGDVNIISAIFFITTNRAVNKKVLVACAAGMSRSVGIVLAYMVFRGWDYDDAFLHIRKKRPVMNPCYLVELSIKRWSKKAKQFWRK